MCVCALVYFGGVGEVIIMITQDKLHVCACWWVRERERESERERMQRAGRCSKNGASRFNKTICLQLPLEISFMRLY